MDGPRGEPEAERSLLPTMMTAQYSRAAMSHEYAAMGHGAMISRKSKTAARSTAKRDSTEDLEEELARQDLRRKSEAEDRIFQLNKSGKNTLHRLTENREVSRHGSGDDVDKPAIMDVTALGDPEPLPRDNGKRHKWKLYFRLKQADGAEDSDVDTPREFFVIVVDPPLSTGVRPSQSYFASEMACQVANIVVGKPLLETLAGQCLLNKTVCCAGRECLVAGLVAAMLGSKVAFLCHFKLTEHLQQNIRMHVKEALDYTRMKSSTVTAVGYAPGRTSGVSGLSICDELNVSPALDLVLLSESEAAAIYSALAGCDEEHWNRDRQPFRSESAAPPWVGSAQLGGEREVAPLLHGGVQLLQPDEIASQSSINLAIKCLNESEKGHNMPICREDFCIMYSQRTNSYVLLYREGKKLSALEALGLPEGKSHSRDYVFKVLDLLAPLGASTKVLLFCNRKNGICSKWYEDTSFGEDDLSIDDLETNLDVPSYWDVRPFCGFPGKFAVLMCQRVDVEVCRQARNKPINTLRKYLPPMGASSSKSGCGGFPQKSFLNHTVTSAKWVDNNSRLKEAIQTHNRLKLGEASQVLEEARTWAATAAIGTLTSRASAPFSEDLSADRSVGRMVSADWVEEASADAAAALAKVASSSSGSAKPSTRRASGADRRSSLLGSGPLSARVSGRPKGPDISQRHQCPPHFYSCQRAYYTK